jgi:hypothetical protein
MLNTQALNTAREILFQGERIGTKLPAALVESLELYESLMRLATGGDLTSDSVAQMIAMWVMNWTGPAIFDADQELRIPTRNETVRFVRSAPWDCSVVRNQSNDLMVVMNTRMQLVEDEQSTRPAKQSEKREKKEKKEAAKAAV